MLLAEKSRGRISRLIPARVQVRRGEDEQACLDLAYAGAADVMLLDLDADEFADPAFITRVRFISRCAFPLIGVTKAITPRIERLLLEGLADAVPRAGLTPVSLERRLRHWAAHHRLRIRLQHADRQSLEWWRNLIEGLDEVRGRITAGIDSTEAFLALIDGLDGARCDLRRRHLDQARKRMAEMRQIAADLEHAAQIIRRKGIARSKRDNLAGRQVLLPEGWTRTARAKHETPQWLDPPGASESGRRTKP